MHFKQSFKPCFKMTIKIDVLQGSNLTRTIIVIFLISTLFDLVMCCSYVLIYKISESKF